MSSSFVYLIIKGIEGRGCHTLKAFSTEAKCLHYFHTEYVNVLVEGGYIASHASEYPLYTRRMWTDCCHTRIHKYYAVTRMKLDDVL